MTDLINRLEYWIERIELYHDIDYVDPTFILNELKELKRMAIDQERIHESNLDFIIKANKTMIYQGD